MPAAVVDPLFVSVMLKLTLLPKVAEPFAGVVVLLPLSSGSVPSLGTLVGGQATSTSLN